MIKEKKTEINDREGPIEKKKRKKEGKLLKTQITTGNFTWKLEDP